MVLDFFRILKQTVPRFGILVENHFLDSLSKFWLDFVVDGQHSRIDDAHVESGLARVVKEARVHGFSNEVVAAKGKGDVADSSTCPGMRASGLDFPDRIDEVDAVRIVFGHARGQGKNVGVENDVFGREPDFLDEDFVRPLANPHFVVQGSGLALFVKGHDYDGGSVEKSQPRLLLEYFGAFLQADRVDDAFALDYLQARFYDRPLRTIDHNRDPGDVGFRNHEVQEAGHAGFAVQEGGIKIDV